MAVQAKAARIGCQNRETDGKINGFTAVATLWQAGLVGRNRVDHELPEQAASSMPGTRKSTAFPVGPRVRAIAEGHLIGRAEQQQPAGNLEGGMPIPSRCSSRFPSGAITTKIEAAIMVGAADRANPSMSRRDPGTLERWRAD